MQTGAASTYANLYALQAIIASVLLPHTMTSPLTLISLPLFPLHTVLFPGGYLPLRVFEPRYRMMVRCCREQGAPFGVVTLLTGEEVQQPEVAQETFYPIGTIARIDSISPMHSGLELIHCLGKDRFRISRTRQLLSGLWVADVELIAADLPIPIPVDLEHSVTALRQVLEKMPQRHLDIGNAQPFNDCGWVANRWCELFPLATQLQVQLLEEPSPLLRLELVTDALERSGILMPQHSTAQHSKT